MFDAKNCPFCLKKLSLRHFCRECRENLSIRVLRTKFWVKSACEDAPQVVPACFQILKLVGTVWVQKKAHCANTSLPLSSYLGLLFTCDTISDINFALIYNWPKLLKL